ncbi:uncharacterized protein LOC133791964 [Humulus lupulus]|uniref:uncharacterized protein LOC133791964 n=1 Tax=Humulus lupulus TaxID=3486 RepID=UPI002B4147E9|nr:uncharacterized protein LOC133791964 [Humulus lupulus]
MPNYVKFLKGILTKKRRLGEFETVALTEGCSAMLKSKIPPKLKDPGSFTIPCSIGGRDVGRALCDLGASINLMPMSIFKKLDYEADREVPIILGRPFLATGHTLIDVQNGELTMRVNDQQVTFSVFKAMKFPDEVEECSRVDVIDTLVAERISRSVEKAAMGTQIFVNEEDYSSEEEQIITWVDSYQPVKKFNKVFEALNLPE